eukprot:289360-Chlamydomonas_euryale.AAC.1
MVGAATRMRAVRELLLHVTGREPAGGVDPEEVRGSCVWGSGGWERGLGLPAAAAGACTQRCAEGGG